VAARHDHLCVRLQAQDFFERREAFVLTQLVGVPYAEAAIVCRVPIGTIRSRVARAREDLQLELGEAAG
jgi:RNA polymerase sigma-70 factor (ECF subfamily)